MKLEEWPMSRLYNHALPQQILKHLPKFQGNERF